MANIRRRCSPYHGYLFLSIFYALCGMESVIATATAADNPSASSTTSGSHRDRSLEKEAAPVSPQSDSSPDASSPFASESPFEGIVFYCTQCMREVPEKLGAGTECPHCGAYFRSATQADGTESVVDNGKSMSLQIGCGIAILLIFGAEYLVRRWRRGK